MLLICALAAAGAVGAAARSSAAVPVLLDRQPVRHAGPPGALDVLDDRQTGDRSDQLGRAPRRGRRPESPVSVASSIACSWAETRG